MPSWSNDLKSENLTLSNFNLSIAQNKERDIGTVVGVPFIRRGKGYYEIVIDKLKGSVQVGFVIDGKHPAIDSLAHGIGSYEGTYAMDSKGMKGNAHDWSKYGTKIKVGDIIGCAVDLDNREISFFKNGKSIGVAFKDIPVGEGITYRPAVSLKYHSTAITAHFSEDDMEYDIPDGFTQLVLDATQEAPQQEQQQSAAAEVSISRVNEIKPRMPNAGGDLLLQKFEQIVSVNAT
eukprot:GEZU01030045.1.p1 GENE.GEZU01030045.1~~GEZU01030045.1.p1  ORF type:complete len:234 (-),score=56.42 GEZU01030045.1:5-706(-)